MHRLRRGLLGSLIPFAPHAFVRQCQYVPVSRLRLWCSSLYQRISPLHKLFQIPLTYSSYKLLYIVPNIMIGIHNTYLKPPRHPLSPFLLNNACPAGMTETSGTDFARTIKYTIRSTIYYVGFTT